MIDIARAFDHGKAFIAFVTAGDPSLEATETYVKALVAGGADLIEIGIPFSDPIAEGPVIQQADQRALASGTTVDRVFEMVARLQTQVDVPLVFLTYLNPVFHYGYPAFFQRCRESDISGLIIPDLPFEEQAEIRSTALSFGVAPITMVAPTSDDRIARIATQAEGFIYAVSSLGVTGERRQITTDLSAMISQIRRSSDRPVAVGFGVHSPEQARSIGRMADGVIVGSHIVSMIGADPAGAPDQLFEYAQSMKQALLSID
ncbi:MAG: tryptophan synthase subunit alpha [Propionibacteriaceae bacterium]|nr:tryptophan synthase subunit alpha [Propionibacteriaceae bacterium]